METIPRDRSSLWLFAGCLIAPVVFETTRKLIIGHPYFLVAAGFPVVLVAWFIALRYSGRMPVGIRIPLLTWIGLQFLYWILAIPRGIGFSAIAFFTHIVPILMAWVAYKAMSRADGIRPVYRFYAVLGLFLLPFGFASAVFGRHVLPSFLLASERMLLTKGGERLGLSTFAGIFSSHSQLSMTYLAMAYLAMAYVCLHGGLRKRAYMPWIVLIVSVLLIYFSTRRGAFYALIPGSLFLILLVRSVKVKSLMIVGLLLVTGVMVYLDTRSTEKAIIVEGRIGLLTDVSFEDRFYKVFLRLWLEACDRYPLGTFLGSASREGVMYGFLSQDEPSEIGAQVVVRETGVPGVIILFIVTTCLIVSELRLCRRVGKENLRFCHVLVLFQFIFFTLWFTKEWTAIMAGSSMSHLLFWSIPGMVAGIAEREQASVAAYHYADLPSFQPESPLYGGAHAFR